MSSFARCDRLVKTEALLLLKAFADLIGASRKAPQHFGVEKPVF